MAQEIITQDGEIISDGEVLTQVPAVIDTSTLSALVKAEIDTAITTARAYPRSIKRAIDNIVELATLDEPTAIECIYAVKRGAKTLRGPSIRMAEVISQQWGNARVDARVVQIDRANKMIVAEGTFHDLETNLLTKATVQRRISDKYGRIYGDDMIQVTGNAACSIAKRNAILGGVPKGIWRRAVEAAENVIRGDAKTLSSRRATAIAAFAHFGLQPEQVFAIMDVAGEEDIGLDDLVTLRGTYSALKNNEITVDELLRGNKPVSDHKRVANPLADEDPAQADNGDSKPAAAEKKPAAKDKPADKTPAEIAAERGAEAKRQGHLRKAMPAEYRDDARKAEADAWLAAYDAEPEAGA